MVVRPRVRRESCRIRWLEFLFTRRKLRRESRREKLLRAPVEGFHAACGRFETQSQENARRLIELCCRYPGTQNDLKPQRSCIAVLIKRLGKDRRLRDERETGGTRRSERLCQRYGLRLTDPVLSTDIEFGRSQEIGGVSSRIWQWTSFFAVAASKRSRCT